MEDRARRVVQRIQAQVYETEALGLQNIRIVLSPWYYEQCLIVKGLPHGLGQLGSWGPQLQARPISQWRGKSGAHDLRFQVHGLSKIIGRDDDGVKEFAIVGE